MSVDFLRVKQKLRSVMQSDGSMQDTYDLVYLAKSDDVTELSVVDVKNYLGLRTGQPFGDDPNATLGDIEIDRRATIPPHCAWDVRLSFATGARVPQSDSQDPTQWRTKRSKRYREITRYIVKDRDDKLIVNAAGDPYPGGVPAPDYPSIFVYDWNRNVKTDDAFHGSINLNAFNGCDPFTLLCLITSEEVFEGAFHYWKETIEMHYDKYGWKIKPVNAGLKQLYYPPAGGDPQKVDCLDDQNQPLPDPQPLYDGTRAGTKKGQMVAIADRPDKCDFLTVEHFEIKDFSKIGVSQFP